MIAKSLFVAIWLASGVLHAQSISSHPPMRALATASKRDPAATQSRFVDPGTGDDRGGDGTAAKPWKTIAHAVKRLKPGDTLYLGGGTYFESVTVDVNGTAAAPITIRSAANELAIIDAGIPELAQSPQTAWELVPGSTIGEYRTTKSYPALARTDDRVPVAGHFVDSMIPLHPYRFAEDLRSKNELWNVPSSQAPGNGIYLGPGIWFDPATHRIHARFAPTTVNQINYAGANDPRKLALSIGGSQRSVLTIEKAKFVRIQDVVIRGGATTAVKLDSVQHVELDGVAIHGGSPGLQIRATDHFRLVRSTVRGLAAPWSSRASMKYRSTGSYMLISDGTGPQNRDWELAFNEFTDGHDGIVLASNKGVRFHHNLVENFNDDGIYLTTGNRKSVPEEIHLHENVFSRILSTLAFAQDTKAGNPIGTGIYVYRNVFDLRYGTYGMPRKKPNEPLYYRESRACGDHGGPTWEPLFVYHNTFINDGTAWRSYYGAQLVMGSKATRLRLFNNIFAQLSGTPGVVFPAPEHDIQTRSNLLWSSALGAQRDFFSAHRGTPAFEKGLAANDIYADPQLTQLAGLSIDVRIAAKSAAIDVGAPLPATWPDTLKHLDRGKPDIGALPAGAPMLRVGPSAAPKP